MKLEGRMTSGYRIQNYESLWQNDIRLYPKGTVLEINQ